MEFILSEERMAGASNGRKKDKKKLKRSRKKKGFKKNRLKQMSYPTG